MKGTNLLKENGALRRLITKKRKTHELSESLMLLSDSHQKAATTLADAMRDMTTTLNVSSEDDKVQALSDKMNAMERKSTRF